MNEQEELAARCTDIGKLSRKALDWVNNPENADQVEVRRKDLTKLLRKSARRADRLSQSAKTKMSVSVFGPSQAGKSFLVSVLARPNEGRLVADFNGPGGKLDYISQVNPAGDGESTGLVTRFTMTKDPTPDGYPIRLNLLSEADIARTIINSFYEDGDQSETPPDAEVLRAHLAAHSSLAQGADVKGLDFEEVYEIADYVEVTFAKAAYASGLKGFWDDAAELAPRLAIEDRATFLSILWGGHQPLTDLYLKLSKALASINHAEVIFAPLEALQPRETSIIDVNTLQGLFKPDGSDPLAIVTAAGQQTVLDRALITALAAELVFPMEEQPSEFFAETDLLDFPGARNRPQLPLTATLKDPEESVTNMLLRGKVAYLFDRYVANQEITSMLLCIGEGNMETVPLPPLVVRWIEMTHGATPKERETSDCILFFVLTKFDMHLGDKASGGDASERFERRMDASLLKGFGQLPNSWVHKWTETQPFQNCFWLRNPNFFVEGLINYDENQRELEIRPEKIDRVNELKAGCLNTPAVQTHFKDAERAWNAALDLNDGGVSLLVEELTKVCKPGSKLRQIGAQIEMVARRAHQELEQFHISDDIGQRIEEKRLAAAKIIDGLEQTLSSHRFGAFLNALSVDQDLVQDRIARVPSSIRITNAVGSDNVPPRPTEVAAPVAARPSAPLRPGAPVRPAPVAEAVPEAASSETARQQIRTMTPEVFQADTAVEVWIEQLNVFRNDDELLAAYQIDPEAAGVLVNEMIHGFRRLGLRELTIEQLKTIAYGLTVDKQAPPASIVCSERINDFVTSLGARHMNGDRPVIDLGDGQSRPAFEKRLGADSADGLPAFQRQAANDTWTDWVFTLEALLVGNAKDGDTGEINIEQNQMLGEVLTGLNGAGGAA